MIRKFFLLLLFSFSLPCFADRLIIEPDMGREPILSAINQAKSSVDLAIYGLTDKECIQALQNAKNNEKIVRVLIEKSPYKSEKENTRAIQQLKKADIFLQWPDKTFKLFHQKTFIFDERTAMIMTFNLTHSAFSNQRNFALITTQPALVAEIEQVFQADWHHEAPDVHQSNLLWSPNNSRAKILELIQSARHEIDIYAQNVMDYETIGALAKAAKSGVKIHILTSTNPNDLLHKNKFAFLEKAGVEIEHSEKYVIHAKVIVVDQKAALLGSINLTKASIDDNRELSVITRDPEVIHLLLETFHQDWSSSAPIAASSF